ncbi:phospholipase A2 inhibitor and Ly6/PLAUR domain-containing protein-like [Ahaetulla prasina]|uniref:phospholipase A2 inhibitor and Ly6/PLAUR domain-containing protein-like n=1 Tax=Ahaetulla prasina TaxID=499056 RepID=UPI0026471B47|nr:phospholipase A2 inhibitor and Ly6/PLAUR domain-containing protein-like [Ahaetulla prasina]
MRAAGILVFCLFSSILSTVTSLKCQKCFAFGTVCEGGAVKVAECKEDEEFCSTIAVNTTMSTISVNFIVKECSKREDCFIGVYSTTTVDGRFEIARANCCQTDVCNAEPFLLENYDELQPNGLHCPGCFALDEDSCEANQSVNCVGDEDQCLTLSNTITAFGNFTEKSSYQGCTTKNSCSFPLGFSEMADGQIQFNTTVVECRNASSPEPDHP